MSNLFIEKLNKKIIVFDGAMGTMLMAAGLSPGEIPEVWNRDRADRVKAIHNKYFQAGSDVVETNTFGGNPLMLAKKGLADHMTSLNLDAVKLAREVCPKNGFVAGSIGPTGQMLEPHGNLSFREAEEAFYQQASVLILGGVDLLCIETMFSLDEALAALRGTKRAGDVPVCSTMTFIRTQKGFFTMMGEGINQCVKALEEADADMIGSNCTLGSRDMIDLTSKIREVTEKPVLIQPNAGKPVTRRGVTLYEQTPQEFARDGVAIREAGADMIGGCCGTDDAFIRALAGALS